MSFLFINTQEITALMELPLIQRVAYLMAIRPYMDRQTCVVGIKRRISYQSIREILYVAPIAGVKTGSPSIQQVRRAVKALERAGLISIQSTEKNLIVKCILVEVHQFNQNKAGTYSTSQSDNHQVLRTPYLSGHSEAIDIQVDIAKLSQADIPHNSVNNIVFLEQKFEKFWLIYPLRQNKQKAWEAFQKLNPDTDLFEQIISALQNQVTHYQQLEQSGHWVPHWKYPANWIEQQCWQEELITYMERSNASHQRRSTTKSNIDIFWESCKDGADYAFNEDSAEFVTTSSNIIHFPNIKTEG